MSLRIIVKFNVNRQGLEMEDHAQPIGLVLITMREWFSCHLKEVRVLVNALRVVKSFYFNHKNYNFLACDCFKKRPIFH